MKLNDIDFGVVFNASGARGFYGEGWPFHRLLKPFGLNYEGSTFVSKTLTHQPKIGHLKSVWFPKCIKIYPGKECVLNAVGLTNPGFYSFLFESIPDKKNPFRTLTRMSCLPPQTILSVAGSPQELSNMSEWLVIAREEYLFKLFLTSKDQANIEPVQLALQLNSSCPNVENNYSIQEQLDALDSSFPVIVKVGVHFDLNEVLKLQEHPKCSALSITNTLPWGHPLLNCKNLFGSDISPLAKFGGGGLSGKPLFPLMIDYLSSLRAGGWKKPIIAGGGILSTRDIDNAFHHGANAIELGSVSLLKPWRVQSLIKYANSKWEASDL